ncbi:MULTISPECIES: hypothetical protein [unclassified Nocardiopsis]|uniref:hypothetical protein n=1 Tax=Nocardiopsis TaxID=2013 RepID=UPI00387AAB14
MQPCQDVPAAHIPVFTGYAETLEQAPLGAHTRRAYASRVWSFLTWLEDAASAGGDALTDAHGRDFAARDCRAHLKTVLKRSAAIANAHLVALDHFFTHLGLDPANVGRDEPLDTAPRVLEPPEQKRFLHAVEKCPLARDQAIGRLLFHSGLWVSELVALDVEVPRGFRTGFAESGHSCFPGQDVSPRPRRCSSQHGAERWHLRVLALSLWCDDTPSLRR